MKKDDIVYLHHILDANVNLSVVWDTVQDDLPTLQNIIKSILE